MCLMARSTKRETMHSKEAVCKKSIGGETKGIIDLECSLRKVETRVIEGTELDTRIVSDLREIEIMVESTKIGEGREEGEGRGEEMKGREARMVGEECRRDTMGSSAWPWIIFGMLIASSPLACIANELFLILVFCLSLLIERLILRWSNRYCCRRA